MNKETVERVTDSISTINNILINSISDVANNEEARRILRAMYLLAAANEVLWGI